MSLVITNPLATKPGSVTIGSKTTPAGMGNAGTLIGGINPSTPSAPKTATPTAAPAAAPAGGSASSGSTYVDPYAGTVFGSTAGYNQAVSDYNSNKDATFGLINNGIGSAASGYGSSIQDYLDAEKQQQNSINNEGVQNELAHEQGTQGILDMVGNGIKSGGVILANDNAGSSSAGEALARAYGTLGRQQQSSVNNQTAQGQAKIDTDQENLTEANATETRHTQEDKVNTINSIVNDATSKIASLNQAASSASLPERLDIDSQIAQIKAQATSALSAYDSELSSGIAANAPASADDNQAAATKLLNAGTAPEQPFDYTTDVPASLSGSGQFASSLPIFIAKKQPATA